MLLNEVPVLTSKPKGWRVLHSATTAPRGYAWIANKESRFSKEKKYRHALIREENL